jgi:predicted MFS family arabinose efflux permease
MNRVLVVVAFASFVSSLFIRMTDPLVPLIAEDLAVAASTAALLGTAFALPWALMQPILGPLGDFLGKTRVILTCMVVLVVSAAIGALAQSFPVLLISRVISGAAAGGVFPVSMAVYGDLVPVESRQIGMGRLLTASISGTLLGGALSGVLADFFPWRGIFVLYGLCMLAAVIVAAGALSGVTLAPPRRVHVNAIVANYRQVLGNPRSKVCYGAVFAEGVAIMGLFPFVAVLLVSIGETRSSVAGAVLSAFPLGGVVYSLAVRWLVARFSTSSLMLLGGGLAAAGLLVIAFVPPWPVQMVTFFLMGFGFFTLHGCILVQMTELAPEARGTATAGHAFFYFTGQALGPVAYAGGLALLGAPLTIVLGGVATAAIAWMAAHLLFPVRASTE